MVQIRLTGGLSNTNPDGSLGGVMSSTQLVDAVIQNAFDNITRKEVLISKTEYRALVIFNESTTLPIHGAILFIDEFPAKTTITIGLDPVGSGDQITTGISQTIATEDTAPSGVTFEDAGEFKVKLALPNLKPLEGITIWIKRITEAGGGQTLTLGITIKGNDSLLIPANLTINDNTVANPTLVTTTTNHGLVTGNQITITGSDSTPSLDGTHIITKIDADTFSVPVNVTIAGTTGTVAIGGDAIEIDGLSIGERTSIVALSFPFLVGSADVGFSEVS